MRPFSKDFCLAETKYTYLALLSITSDCGAEFGSLLSQLPPRSFSDIAADDRRPRTSSKTQRIVKRFCAMAFYQMVVIKTDEDLGGS